MKNIRPFIIVGGVAIIATALYRYYRRQIDFIKDITYKITRFNIRSISASLVSLDITTQIYNASNVEATVTEIYLDIVINGVKVGNVNEVKDMVIKPMQTSDVTFNVSFNPRLIGQNIVDILKLSLSAKNVLVDVNGYLKVKSSFIRATVPFEYQNDLKTLLNK
jgi:LEA14-like dessication related protein